MLCRLSLCASVAARGWSENSSRRRVGELVVRAPPTWHNLSAEWLAQHPVSLLPAEQNRSVGLSSLKPYGIL